LIVVDGNPLEDIQNVRRLLLVLKEGVIVSDKRDPWAKPRTPGF
jgi:imidazolonepropionase-like amidohydrolase